MLQEAREKQAQILKEAAQTRDDIVEKAQEKAKTEGARLLSEAKAEIESEKQQAISDIRAQVAELSVEIAGKVLREKLSSDAEQMKLIERLLDDVTAKK
jgi:F-type H+-transporting ATPase subunit b